MKSEARISPTPSAESLPTVLMLNNPILTFLYLTVFMANYRFMAASLAVRRPSGKLDNSKIFTTLKRTIRKHR